MYFIPQALHKSNSLLRVPSRSLRFKLCCCCAKLWYILLKSKLKFSGTLTRNCELRKSSGISFAKSRWFLAVLLPKTRSAREVEQKGNGANIHPWKIHPALLCSLHPNSITLIFLHAFRVMHWICTQNRINPLRTEHFCPSAWPQPLSEGWSQASPCSRYIYRISFPVQWKQPMWSRLGETSNIHVQSVYGRPFVPPSRHRGINPSLQSLPDAHQARHYPEDRAVLTENPVQPPMLTAQARL